MTEDLLHPEIISFPKFGFEEEGFISIAAKQYGFPFEIKRIFWAYDTPGHIVRGRHAHINTSMVIVAAVGTIKIECSRGKTYSQKFILNNPNEGLLVPPMFWHTMKYSKGALQLVITNTDYDENDYIRDHKEYLKMVKE
jgi:hypothetical protein